MANSMSPEIGELAKALVLVQGEMGTIPKDSTNPFFRSKYADLATVSGVLIPILTKYGLSVSQLCSTSDKIGQHTEEFVDSKSGRIYKTIVPYLCLKVRTVLMHVSGQWIAGELETAIAKNDPQGIGSAITYARRYSLMAIVGAVADEDDDGNAGSKEPERPSRTQRPQTPDRDKKPEPAASPEEDKPNSNIAKLHTIFSKAKLSENAYKAFLSVYKVESSKDMDDVTIRRAIEHAVMLVGLLQSYANGGLGADEISALFADAIEQPNPFLATFEQVKEMVKAKKQEDAFMKAFDDTDEEEGEEEDES